ncbi:MAG TPA: dienelactone hydrolase family protein [Dehalococcoidia bacterium]|nr:dienelactone hydrolase family protein [Dehalococcoidia bacterium]
MPAPVHTEMVSFSSNGDRVDGLLARPEGSGPFPGVIVIQEWWGLDDHIKDVAARLAAVGFAALAPDLYHGTVTHEPDEAQKMMMALDMSRATRELTKAADYLASQPFIAGRGIGAIGFCMGGGLAMSLACNSRHVKAVAPFYGANPDPIDQVANLQGPVFAAYAQNDAWITPPVRDALAAALRRHGKQSEMKVYEGTDHAFFNDTRPEVHNSAAAADAWEKALKLFRDNL